MQKATKAKAETGTALAAEGPKKHADEGSASPQGKRYGEAVKRLVVEQIEAGKLTVSQAQRAHGIAGTQTIRAWQAKYGKSGGGVRRASAMAAAQAEIARLRREKAELERALTRQTVKAVTLECAMEEAEAQFGEGFKKKFGPAVSSAREAGSARKG
jgi:transposase-like protein